MKLFVILISLNRNKVVVPFYIKIYIILIITFRVIIIFPFVFEKY